MKKRMFLLSVQRPNSLRFALRVLPPLGLTLTLVLASSIAPQTGAQISAQPILQHNTQPSLQAVSQPLIDAPLPAAKSQLPQLGLSADEFLSPAQEKALGRIIWRDLRSEPDVLTDGLTADYLQQLVHKLSAQLPLPAPIALRAFAVADPQLNAFAMPSGLIGIHTGLILSVAQEGELAGVIAHEIGHVSQRHFARGMAHQKGDAWIAWAGFAAALIAARNSSAKSGQVFESALAGSQALVASRQLSFSRDMEREADAVGFALMRDAAYDASDMVRMLRRLSAAGNLSETASGYAKSHPGSSERMANIEGRLKAGAVARSSAQEPTLDFLLAQARVRALLAKSPEQIEFAQSSFNAQLDRASQIPSGLPATTVVAYGALAIAAQYGLCQLAMQAKAWPLAQQRCALNAAHFAHHPWLLVQSLELQLAINEAKPQPDTSASSHVSSPASSRVSSRLSEQLAAQLSQLPEPLGVSVGSNASAAVHMVQAALEHTQSLSKPVWHQAHEILLQWLHKYPLDDSAWQSLAQLYAQQGNHALALWAQAEQTAAMGVWPSSIGLYSEALRKGETSVPVNQQNQWRDRLREIRQIAAEEKLLLDKFK